jgi:hypothetical protein
LPGYSRVTANEGLALTPRSPREKTVTLMPWNESYYPRSMEHLPPLVRSKAIEIANALLDEGYEEGMAIRIAIAKAKEWAERRGLL